MLNTTLHPNQLSRRSGRRRFLSAAVLGCLLAFVAATAVRADVTEWFTKNPLVGGGGNAFFAEGDPAARFTHRPGDKRRFPGDRRGGLRVLYDTTQPQARISTPIGRVLSFDDDFGFGAILTIRSVGFFADPDGFSQIAFGLWNSATTGFGRTLFPSDSFDLLEFDYFPNVTSFGGPFLTPTVFGGNVGGNAFFNFSFVSKQAELPFDVPLLCQFQYDAATRRLTVVVSRHRHGVEFTQIPGARASLDLGGLNPTFLVDVVGIAAYFEGFASLRATVDYDLLYFGDLPEPFKVGRRRVQLPE